MLGCDIVLYAVLKSTRVLSFSEGESASLVYGRDQAWVNPENFSANPKNLDNYFWKI